MLKCDFFFNVFRSRSSKLAKTSHPTTEVVVSLGVNYEEHLLRLFADTDASNSVILYKCTRNTMVG